MSVTNPIIYDNTYIGNIETGVVDILKRLKLMDNIPNLKNCLKNGQPRDFQTVAIAMGYYNKRFILGDRPGLGKTIEMAGILNVAHKKGQITEVLMFVPNTSLDQISDKMEYFGYLPVCKVYSENGHSFNRRLREYEYFDHENKILLAPHSALTNNNFIKWLLSEGNIDRFNTCIVDESRIFKNNKNISYKNMYQISKMMDRVIFANGTLYECSLNDVYNQIDCCNPYILPRRTTFSEQYQHQSKTNGYRNIETISGRVKRVYTPKFSYYGIKEETMVDLQEKIGINYLIRSKSDISDYVPTPTIEPILCDITPEHRVILDKYGMDNTLLNSPLTRGVDMDYSKLSKLDKLLETVDELIELGEKFVIYSHHRHMSELLQLVLEDRGIRTGLIYGKQTREQRTEVLKEINDVNGNMMCLITNVMESIDIPNVDYMLLYEFPYNPARFLQLISRIDRDNYTVSKNYFLYIYDESSELDNIEVLLSERAKEGSSSVGVDYSVIDFIEKWFKDKYPQYRAGKFAKALGIEINEESL